MKQQAKIIALLLAFAVLVSLFAACGKTETPAAETPDPAAAEPEATQESEPAEVPEPAEEPEPAQETEPAQEPEPAEAEAPAVTIEYPVTEDATYSLCYSMFSFLNNMLPNGYADSPFFEAFREATGVGFESLQLDGSTASEKLQLMVASDSLCDIHNGLLGVYTGGAAQILEDEVALDIMEYADECLPDYLAAIRSFDNGLAQVTLDDGRSAAIYELYSTDHVYYSGYFIRDDMLEATGLSMPTTLDELLDVARAMRDNGVEYPIYANTDLDDTGLMTNLWTNEWGYIGYYWDAEAQCVRYSLVEDWALDYIKWLRGVWNEGLFITSGAASIIGMSDSFSDLFKAGKVGIFTSKNSSLDDDLRQLEGTVTATPLACFTGTNTEQGDSSSIVGEGALTITAGCQDPETLMKAINYLYTEDGAFLNNYGLEGTGFTYDAGGEPRYTDMVMNNPSVPLQFAKLYYTSPIVRGLTDPDSISYTWSDCTKSASDIWRSAYTGNSASFSAKLIHMTAEESDSISVYLSDLSTHCTEILYKMVYGDLEPTQEAFDSFVDDCYNTLMLQDILDVYTAAWLRTLERSN